MRALVLHDAVGEHATADAADALVQASMVAEHLQAAGWQVTTHPCGLDLTPTVDALRGATLAINLVESLGGQGRLIHLVPTLVESMSVPMTGCPARAIHDTSNKLLAKHTMRAAGIDTPDCVTLGDRPPTSGRWIVKSVWEHASIGIDDASIADAAQSDMHTHIERLAQFSRGPCFAEAYIEGREFNLSLLEISGQPTVLTPAEIEFVGFGDRPRIVGYAAKWNAGSFEYENTPRRFDFPPADAPLLESLRTIALRCWHLFHLRGYARVDFRVDAGGRPRVLEINTNPCISPDAGYMAAAQHDGLSQRSVVEHILAASHRGRHHP